MLWGATGGAVIDLGKNTYKALTGDFDNMKWDSSFGNIKGGWNKVYGAGQHMNETSKMHDDYLLDEATKEIKRQVKVEDFRKKTQFSEQAQKDFVYQPIYSANIADFDFNKILQTKTLDTKVIDNGKKALKPNVTVNNNQTYNPSFVINEATDGAKIKNMFDTQMRNYKEQEEQKIRAQIGMNYGI